MHVSCGAQSTLERYAVRAEAVFNRVPYYSATKTTLFRVGREARDLVRSNRACAPAGATGLRRCERRSHMHVS